MLAVAEPAVPLWLYLLVPLLGVVLTGGMFYAALYPKFRDRRQVERERREREERLDNVADIVLGRAAAPARGLGRLVGLQERLDRQDRVLADLRQTIGSTNGSGKSIVDHVAEVNAKLAEHIAHDDDRFNVIDARLSGGNGT